MTDRITRVTIQFENESGTEVTTRVCIMNPMSTFIKSSSPQGKCPGNLEVRGLVIKQEDRSGGA